MLLLLLLILLVLIAILIRLCIKDRKPLVTSADCHNAGVARVVWGILLVILGFVFPPFWLIAFFVLAFAHACFKEAKRLSAGASAYVSRPPATNGDFYTQVN